MAINGFHQSSMVLAERPMLLKLSLMEEHSLLVTFHIIYEPTSLPLEKIEYVYIVTVHSNHVSLNVRN